MLRIGSKRKKPQLEPTQPTMGTTTGRNYIQGTTSNKAASRHAYTSSNILVASKTAPAHCSNGVLPPKHNTSAPSALPAPGTMLLPPLPSCNDENASSSCLQDSIQQTGRSKPSINRQLLQDTAPDAPANTTYSTKAFWDLTAAMEEDDQGCAAAACLTASAGKQQQQCSQRTAPAAQQQVLQQQPVVWRQLHPQQQQHQQQRLLASPSAQHKQHSLKAASGFRRLQTTPGTAMFSTVLNGHEMPDDLADSDDCSDDDQEQPAASTFTRGFTAVLQQELQEQLAAAAAHTGGLSAGASAAPVQEQLAAASVNISSGQFLDSSRGSQQDASPTRTALAAAAPAATAKSSSHQHSLAGQAIGSSAAAYVSTQAQDAACSPGTFTTLVEGDAERFLVACLQPGVVQALAVLLHADILPLCSEDGTGSLLATLAYMLILATRSSILQSPAHAASCSTAVQAASSASATHKLLTLLWMAESFSSQYRDSCKLVLFDYMFYPACVSMEDPEVTSILKEHTLVCVQLQAAFLGSSSFRLWVQPEELAAACQVLAAAKGGSLLVFLQAAVQARVCQLHQKVQQQLALLQQQLKMTQPAGAAAGDLALEQEPGKIEAQQLQHGGFPARQSPAEQKQASEDSAGLFQQPKQQSTQLVGPVPQDGLTGQQPTDCSRPAKKPRMAGMPPPPPQQQQRRHSQRRSAKGTTATKVELQQNLNGRQTRSSSRMMAAAGSIGGQQERDGSSVGGAARTGMLPAASAAAGKAAAMLQSTMRSAKQQLLQIASSLGKRTHAQMQSGCKRGSK